MSLSYQNYDIVFHYDGQPYNATLASFVGFNQYIRSFDIGEETVEVNENKLQGFWAFKSLAGIQTGQTPEGGTTVPNPFLAHPLSLQVLVWLLEDFQMLWS